MSELLYVIYASSPIGTLEITGASDYVTRLHLCDEVHTPTPLTADVPAALRLAAEELRAYFAGDLRVFSVPLRLAGTPFQRAVWAALRAIPFGLVRTYGEIAAAVGNPRAARAVGMANARNPVAVIVPCHRVIAAGGRLGGYGGGLWRKRWLLRHEGHDGALPHTPQGAFAP